ncbi:hypothetical protein M0805_008271 [Coniferiporia weirii]|nr:hypothetical protein M0805_008271 [Coniferiporia weirii]
MTAREADDKALGGTWSENTKESGIFDPSFRVSILDVVHAARSILGDVPSNKFTKLYNYLINVSVVTRWTLLIIPVLALIWIPGILGLIAFKNKTIWHVKLIWWSIWLSVVWGGLWGALAFSGLKKYIDWLKALVRYVALFGWTLAIWISFQPLIIGRSIGNEKAEISFIAKLLLGFISAPACCFLRNSRYISTISTAVGCGLGAQSTTLGQSRVPSI